MAKHSQTGIIVVTHDEKIIPTFKRIYQILDGKKVEVTFPQETGRSTNLLIPAMHHAVTGACLCQESVKGLQSFQLLRCVVVPVITSCLHPDFQWLNN